MVLFRERDEAARTGELIAREPRQLRVAGEFKFSKYADPMRDAFFKAIAWCDFRVRAIVVRKESIYSGRLRSNKEAFYRFLVRSMVKSDNGALEGAKIVVDGSGERTFRQDLKTHLQRHAGAGAIRDVTLKASHDDPLVQAGKTMDALAGLLSKSKGTPLFTNAERANLNRLLDEVKRAQFAASADRTAGSDTARNATVIAKFLREGATGVTGQDIASYVPGATSRVLADTAALGLRVLRRAGAVKALIGDAMLDPALAADLLSQPTPDRMRMIDERLTGYALGTVAAAAGGGTSE